MVKLSFHLAGHKLIGRDQSGQKVGYISFKIDPKQDKIVTIVSTFVNPDFRGQGIAAKLTETFVGLAQRKGWHLKLACKYSKFAFKFHHAYQKLLTSEEKSKLK